MGWRWRGAGRRDEKWRDIGGAGLHLGITKRSDAVDPPRPLRDKESNRQGTDPTSPEHPHLDENNLLWENQTTPLRGAPPRRDCPVDAGSSLDNWASTNLLLGIRCPVRVLQAGHKRGRVLQEEPICHRLREVPERRWRQTISLLQGKQRQVPLLRRGLERGRVLQEEPIYWRLREVQELLPGIQCQVRVLQAGHQRGRVLQEEPIYCRLREVQELLPVSRGQVRGLQAGHQRGRVLQEGPIYFFWTSARLREVQLLQGKQYQVPLLRRGRKRGRVLQEEPTKFSGYTRLREVHNTSR